jgi:hypothetical protein
MKHKYETISPKGNSIIHLLRHVCKKLPPTAMTEMEGPLLMEELHREIKQGKKENPLGLTA